MYSKLRISTLPILVFCGLVSVTHAEGQVLSKGTYRVAGRCQSTTYLGAPDQPVCQDYVGIFAKNPDSPMFIFPLKNNSWFFVASGIKSKAVDSSVVTYDISKLYDEPFNAEFPYPEGECELQQKAPVSIKCTVWKDKEKSTIARQLVFIGSGNWAFSREP